MIRKIYQSIPLTKEEEIKQQWKCNSNHERIDMKTRPHNVFYNRGLSRTQDRRPPKMIPSVTES